MSAPELYLKNTVYVMRKVTRNQMPKWSNVTKDPDGVVFDWDSPKGLVILSLDADGGVFYSAADKYSVENISVEQAVYDINMLLGFDF